MVGTIGRHSSLVGLLAGFGALVAFSGDADAGGATVAMLRDGYNLGPQGDDTGPGAEQMAVNWLKIGEDIYVVTVWMSSEDYTENVPWQGACSSVKLSPNALPEVVVNNVQITNFNTEGRGRVFNHPQLISANDMGKILLAYGSDKNNANPETFVRTMNHMCELDNNEIKISNNPNNNDGAPDGVYAGNGNFLTGYLSTNNNDAAYAVGVHLSATNELSVMWRKNTINPSNIGRPAIDYFSEDYGLFCASKGNNRPPEDGVQCALLDVHTGDIMWKEYVEESDPANKYYVNQPSIARLDNNRYAIQVLISNGQGKNTNIKGSNVSRIEIKEVSLNGMLTKDIAEGLGSYQTHSAICGGFYGEDGTRAFGIFGAPITGNGQPVIQMGTYDATTGIVADKQADKWVVGWYGDSGYLANIYGENPHNQGREFLRCRGDIPNPGFGNPTGFMPDVETFFATPHAGRVDGEPKTSAWFSLVPGKTNVTIVPEPPTDISDAELGAEGQGETVDPGTDPGGDDGGGTDNGGTNGTPDSGDDFGATNAGGCACSTPGTESSNGKSGLAGALALLGLATLVSRRRKES